MVSENISSRKQFPKLWDCPSPAPLLGVDRSALLDAFEQLKSTQNPNLASWQVAGRELRCAMLMLQGDRFNAISDNTFWKAKCNKLLLRPSVESIICMYWNEINHFNFSIVTLAKITSLLSNQIIGLRRGVGTGRAVDGDVHFAYPIRHADWTSSLAHLSTSSELAVLLPLYALASTILTHPFTDGNGRLARALANVAISRYCGFEVPILPLGPIIYSKAENLKKGLLAINEMEDWTLFVRFFVEILKESTAILKKIS